MESKQYIDNKRFEELILQYVTNEGHKHQNNYNELWEMFDLLISNIMEAFKFNLSKEDAKQDCFLLIFKTLKNFSPEKGSAFNFFTTIIMNHLKLIYVKNKKYREKLNQLYERKTMGIYSPSAS